MSYETSVCDVAAVSDSLGMLPDLPCGNIRIITPPTAGRLSAKLLPSVL
jgi:hypothetical protein